MLILRRKSNPVKSLDPPLYPKTTEWNLVRCTSASFCFCIPFYVLMSYLYLRSLFPICCWFILTPWFLTISDKEHTGLKFFFHSMCAVLGLWVVHVILGFNQNWLEMPLMLCHTAAQYFMAGGLWEEHHLLPGVNTVCPMLSAISTSYCCPNLCHLSWSLWDLCVKWKLCLGARLVNCLNRRSKMFLSFSWSHCLWER